MPDDFHEKQLINQGLSAIAGVDEAGRGPLAGPVVAAACILPQGVLFPTLNDSKKLTPKQRAALFEELIRTPGICFGIGQVSAKEIDEINILQATFLAMQRAVSALEITPDYLLIDGNRTPVFPMKSKALVGGDGKSLSIAAASILAKVTRDKMMEEIDEKWPEYGFKKHKGYGTKVHLAAIESWGPCLEHRRTFAPISRS